MDRAGLWTVGVGAAVVAALHVVDLSPECAPDPRRPATRGRRRGAGQRCRAVAHRAHPRCDRGLLRVAALVVDGAPAWPVGYCGERRPPARSPPCACASPSCGCASACSDSVRSDVPSPSPSSSTGSLVIVGGMLPQMLAGMAGPRWSTTSASGRGPSRSVSWPPLSRSGNGCSGTPTTRLSAKSARFEVFRTIQARACGAPARLLDGASRQAALEEFLETEIGNDDRDRQEHQ